MWEKKEYIVSYEDRVAPVLFDDNAADFMHKQLQIRSGLWMPFNFREEGFHLLILNQVTYRREWEKEELDFLTAATSHLSIALQKIKLLKDHRQAEDRFRLFKSAVEASSDAIGMATQEGKHYYQNEAFDKMFGDISSAPDSVYIDKGVWEQVFGSLQKGERWTGETRMRGTDSKILDILLRAYTTRDENGKITNLIGVHTDITERKQAEEEHERLVVQLHQAQKMEAVGQLAGGVAHDFNNILQAIFGFGEMAQSYIGEDNPSRSSIDEILIAAEQAYRESAQISQARRQGYVSVMCTCNVAVTQTDRGLLHRAADTFRQAISLAQAFEEQGGQPLHVVSYAHIYLGGILFEWNQVDDALSRIREGIDRCVRWGEPQLLASGHARLARVLWAVGAKKAARWAHSLWKPGLDDEK